MTPTQQHSSNELISLTTLNWARTFLVSNFYTHQQHRSLGPERCEKDLSTKKRSTCLPQTPQKSQGPSKRPEVTRALPPQPSPPRRHTEPWLPTPQHIAFLLSAHSGRREVDNSSKETWEAAWSGRKSHKADSGSSERKNSQSKPWLEQMASGGKAGRREGGVPSESRR